jgi:hypothetical protein
MCGLRQSEKKIRHRKTYTAIPMVYLYLVHTCGVVSICAYYSAINRYNVTHKIAMVFLSMVVDLMIQQETRNR